MATIVNTTPSNTESNSPVGTILAVLGLLLVVFLVLYYGLPALNRGANTVAPSGAESGSTNSMELQVPEQVDVNVNTPTEGQ